MWASCIPAGASRYELAQAPVLFELELDAVLARDVPVYQPVSRHQAVERDLAIVVKEGVTHAAVIDAIRAPASAWLRDVVLFDVYRPKKQSDGCRDLAPWRPTKKAWRCDSCSTATTLH